jgi:hypothetical protein
MSCSLREYPVTPLYDNLVHTPQTASCFCGQRGFSVVAGYEHVAGGSAEHPPVHCYPVTATGHKNRLKADLTL